LSRAVARELVVYHRRPGGQSQFSTLLELDPASSRIARALGYETPDMPECEYDRLIRIELRNGQVSGETLRYGAPSTC